MEGRLTKEEIDAHESARLKQLQAILDKRDSLSASDEDAFQIALNIITFMVGELGRNREMILDLSERVKSLEHKIRTG